MNKNKELILFGFALERKINLLALIALIISTISIGIQIFQYIEGPNITLRVGDRVNILLRSHYLRPEVPIVWVNARLSYVNSGAVGRNAIIVGERLYVKFHIPLFYEYSWIHFETFVPEADGSPVAKVSDIAHDFMVPGAATESHQTTFFGFTDTPPHSQEYGKTTTDPVTKLDFQAFTRKDPRIVLYFVAEDIDGGTYEAKCELTMTRDTIEAINSEAGWATVFCRQL